MTSSLVFSARAGAKLTENQHRKEAAVAFATLSDIVFFALTVVSAVLSGSLTVLAELLRQALLWLIEVVSWITLRREHRGRLQAFEFGIGKIERSISLMVAVGLVASAVYMVDIALDRLEQPRILPTPALILAVAVGTLNLLQTIYCMIDMVRSNSDPRSLIIESQTGSRVVKTVGLSVVVAVLLIALWLPDPKAASYVDGVGALFVAAYMVMAAVRRARVSVPDLLDRGLPERDQLVLLSVVARYFDDFEHFGSMRTRRSGGRSFVDIELAFSNAMPLGQAKLRSQAIEHDIKDKLPDAVVRIMPYARSLEEEVRHECDPNGRSD